MVASTWGVLLGAQILTLDIRVEEQPLGTAGCLAALAPAEDAALLVYGDMLFDLALAPLADFHRRQSALITNIILQNGGGGGGGSFQEGTHPKFPTLTNHTVPAMAAPKVVAVTFNNDPNAAAIQTFDAWWPLLVSSEFRPALGDPLYTALVKTGLATSVSTNLLPLHDPLKGGFAGLRSDQAM